LYYGMLKILGVDYYNEIPLEVHALDRLTILQN